MTGRIYPLTFPSTPLRQSVLPAIKLIDSVEDESEQSVYDHKGNTIKSGEKNSDLIDDQKIKTSDIDKIALKEVENEKSKRKRLIKIDELNE